MGARSYQISLFFIFLLLYFIEKIDSMLKLFKKIKNFFLNLFKNKNPYGLGVYTPHEAQNRILDYILNDKSNDIITVIHGRRWGGSYLLNNIVLWWALKNKKIDIFYISDKHLTIQYNLKTMVRELNSQTNKRRKKIVFNVRNTRIEFANGSSIHFVDVNNIEKTRGKINKYCVVDNAAFLKDKELRDVLSYSFGKIILVSSPNPDSKDVLFTDIYLKGVDESQKGFKSFKEPTSNNPIMVKELENIRKSMPESAYKYEIELNLFSPKQYNL